MSFNIKHNYILIFISLVTTFFISCQGCKCHDVAQDETCLDCLRSKCKYDGMCTYMGSFVFQNVTNKLKPSVRIFGQTGRLSTPMSLYC